MTSPVEKQLCRMLQKHGRGVCENVDQLEGLMRDYFGEHRREIFVLLTALRAGIVEELVRSNGVSVKPMVFSRWVRCLHEEFGVDQACAVWAASTWASALGKNVEAASATSCPTSTPHKLSGAAVGAVRAAILPASNRHRRLWQRYLFCCLAVTFVVAFINRLRPHVNQKRIAKVVLPAGVGKLIHDGTKPRASIRFTRLPAVTSREDAMRTRPVAGMAQGVVFTECAVVLYSRAGATYYVQPFERPTPSSPTSPLTPIGPGGTWHTITHSGSEYAALLVRRGYRPANPINRLPHVDGDVLAITQRSTSHERMALDKGGNS